ncbi:MAG TPA: DUF58 domain-containing protein [Chitinophagaceae bacterium]|nr:DUF58 domain-containing protein [Chitinophagaceae bacterium]HML58827.1 DUF58 domain-containing protein [Ferruginibacter sp.]
MLTQTEDIIRKVRELEIISKKLTTHLFTGEYHAAFKGKGMRFREVREYAPGDDVRFIDWNVSARFNNTFSKVFEEERELSVMLIIDTSSSNLFGTRGARKRDRINEMAAVLAFSAINNQDKAGAILFNDHVEQYIPPKKSRQHALYLVRHLLTAEPRHAGTNLSEAIKYFNRNIKQRSIAFILSDFIDNQFENALRIIGKKHDVIGIKVYDLMDMELPDAGLIKMKDMETGNQQWVDTSNAEVRYRYHQHFIQHAEWCKNVFRKSGADLLHIRTDEDYVKILQQFFRNRM